MLVVLNPYVLEFANRTSVTLLGYAVAAVAAAGGPPRRARAARLVRGRPPFALLVASTGGGVNAAVTAWLLLAPAAAAALRAAAWARVSWRGAWRVRLARGAAGRRAPRCGGSCRWRCTRGYGRELPALHRVARRDLGHHAASARACAWLGYWLTYLGTGFGLKLCPSIDTSKTLLFDAPTVIASFLIPGLAVAGYAWSRRQRYAPVPARPCCSWALFVMVGGLPRGRAAAAGDHVRLLPRRGRSSSCARPTRPARSWRWRWPGSAGWRPPSCTGACAAGAALAWPPRRPPAVALVVAANWPAFEGKLLDQRVAYDQVPGAWRQAARDVDRDAARHAGAGAARPAVPVLPLGRHPGPDPGRADRPARHGPQHRALQRHPRGRPAVHHRQPRAAAAAGAGPAGAAAGPDERGRGGHRQRRRPRPQRLRRAAGRGPGPAAASPAWAARPPATARGARSAASRATSASAGRCPRCAATAASPARRLVRVAAGRGPDHGRRLGRDAGRHGRVRRAAAHRPLAYAGDRSRRAAAARGPRGAAPWSSATATAGACSPPRGRARTTAPRSAAGDPFSVDAALLDPFPERGTRRADRGAGARREVGCAAPYSPTFPQFPEHRPARRVRRPPEARTGSPTATCRASAATWTSTSAAPVARRPAGPAAPAREQHGRDRGRDRRQALSAPARLEPAAAGARRACAACAFA